MRILDKREKRSSKTDFLFCEVKNVFLNFMVQLCKVINSPLVRRATTTFPSISLSWCFFSNAHPQTSSFFFLSLSLSLLSLSQYKLSLSLFRVCVCVTKTLKIFTLSLSLYFSTLVRRRRLRRTPPLPPTRLGIADTR